MAGRAMNEPRRALLFAFLLAVAACSPQPDAANTAQADPPLAGAAIGGPFTLTGESGTPVSGRDFPGHTPHLYFGQHRQDGWRGKIASVLVVIVGFVILKKKKNKI